MERPDLDAMSEKWDGRTYDDVIELIAYARHLETENAELQKTMNVRLPFLNRMSEGKQVQMVARIAELEAALEPFAAQFKQGPYAPDRLNAAMMRGEWFAHAARVINRKGT